MCATQKIQFARLLSQIPAILTEGSLESRENRQQWYDKFKEFYVSSGQREVSASKENLQKKISKSACYGAEAHRVKEGSNVIKASLS